MMATSTYPLAWPVGWSRTPDWDRKSWPGRISASRIRQLINRELDLIDATNVVISSNVAMHQDGLPYANQALPEDPGVAVYFTRDGKDVVIAIDRWSTVDYNLRAIGATLEAHRAIERRALKKL
jgi:hypothetical protein